jgi:GAF domain-containing protein
MSATPDSMFTNPGQLIADLQRELADARQTLDQRTVERDEAQRQLAERTTERDEALAREAATAEVLQVINSSPSDLAPVFEAMLEKAMRLCEAAFGVLWTFEGELGHAAAFRGVPSAFSEFLTRGPHRETSGTANSRLRHGENVLQIANIADDDAYRSGDPVRRALVELGGGRTMLAVPLRKDDTLLGSFIIYRQEARPFTDKQIALLQNFAAQAVIAMENARLLTETREALEQQTATAEVLAVINSSPGDLAPVFDAMLDKATRLCEASFGILWNFDGEFATAGALHDVPAAYAELCRAPFRPSPGSGPARMMRGEGTLAIANLTQYPPYLAGDQLAQAIVDLAGARSLVIAPLRKDSAVLGAITLYRKEMRPFSDKQIALLENFADQAVIAMENARLLTETREALEQQTAAAEVLQVINSSPGERTPVFDAILEKARILCGAAHGSLSLYDGERFRVVAINTASQEFADRWRQGFLLSDFPHIKPLLEGARLVHVPDLVELGNTYGARTGLFVPLRKDDMLLGLISTVRLEVRPFSNREIALVENFAAQAVIAMENARLLTETREALEQQTATAEVLQVINSSPGDLTPVFDAILEKAHALCGADYGSLLTYDGERLWPIASHGGSERLAAALPEGTRPWAGGGMDEIVRGAPFAHIHDMAELAKIAPDDAPPRSLVEIGGIRTQLIVPLRKDNALLGVITANRQQARPFSDKEIALLQNFAAQAVVAMENARLLTETREALEQQTATAEVLGVINSSPGDLAPVFEVILQKAHDLCGVENGALFMRDGERFMPVALHAPPEPIANYLRQHGLGSDAPAVGPLLDGARFVHIPDMRDIDHPAAQAAAASGVRTILSVPLRKDGLVGTINAVRLEVRPFSEKEIALLENFAAQAVIAIENARLLGELRQRTEEVAELNRGLEARVAEQVDELGRVGRLKRFLAPQLAELIVSQGDEKILESHRREIVVVFCDLRGYTAFTETAEPEEVLDFLREYHGALGPLVSQFEGTLDQFSGDGIMVFFNDPLPIPNPAERAVKMAMAMREAAGKLIAAWRERGRELGFGAGIAQGYATLGQIGFSERSGYTAIGTVCNVAARLCAEAKDGQILLSQLVNVALKGSVTTEQVGALALKGLTQPVVAYNVPLVGSQAAFRVIEGGPPSA